jgi:surfeit locus 1 family protein
MLKAFRARRFSPPVWAAILTAVLVVVFVRLGFWQIHRGQEKIAMISAYQEAAKAVALDFTSALRAGDDGLLLRHRAMQARGRYEPGHTLLLDNQVSHGQPGYHVWSPLRLEMSHRLILVDRGWVPMDADRRLLPAVDTPQGRVSVRGVWEPLPRPGLRVGANDCGGSGWPRVVQYPLHRELQCLLGGELVEGVLWLDPAADGGFRREWQETGFPPERHYGYAFQWFALAGTLLVVFVVVNFRRTASDES